MPFSKDHADRAVKFIRGLKHTQGRQWYGVPFNLLKWQEEEVIRPFFGTLKDDGYRQYRFCYVEVPKKNGKTELAAAVANYCLFADKELGGEVYAAAGDKGQAAKTFNAAMEMVVQNGRLRARTDIIRSQKRMFVPKTNSIFVCLSRETFTKHGYNPSCVIIDELHAHKDRLMYDVLVEGTDTARTQQVVFIITTAGIYDKTSIGWEVHQHALKVKDDPEYDPTFLPIIYALEENEDEKKKGGGGKWRTEKAWREVNPSIDDLVPLEKIRDHYNQIKNIPARQNNFRRFRLNQWVAQIIRWMPMDHWDACGEERIDIGGLRGHKCYGGLDLSSTTDIGAYALVFPPEGQEEIYETLLYFWIPDENMQERARRDKVPYDMWVRSGLMEATPGNLISQEFIAAAINMTAEMFDIKEIAYDRWGSPPIVERLEDMGFKWVSSESAEKVSGCRLIQFGQGYKDMSPPTKELLNLILERRIAHGGNPVLRWMADNVVVRTDPAGNIKPDKEKSVEKIDGIVALIMALDRALRHAEAGSSYDGKSKEEIMAEMVL